MTNPFAGVGHALFQLFSTQKPLFKWVETVLPEKTLKTLTKAYLNPPEFMNFDPLLTKSQISVLQEKTSRFTTDCADDDTGFNDCIAFYAGYPFRPIPVSEMGRDDWIRAVIGMSGQDTKALDRSREARSEPEIVLLQKGRREEDRLRLLFAALSNATPSKKNILDVLFITQPRPNDCWLPYAHLKLFPILDRWDLNFVDVEETSVSRERLRGFVNDIGLEGFEGLEKGESEKVGVEEFLRDCEGKTGILDALGTRTEELFLK